MRIVTAAILIVTGSIVIRGQSDDTARTPDAKTEQELRRLRRDFTDALKLGDRNALERVLADGFTFVHSTGGLENRVEYIDRAVAAARTSQTTDIEFLDDQIRVYEGRTAVWITRSVGRSRGTETYFRGTDVIVKIGGRWQWASVHSTRLPTRPKAAIISTAVSRDYVGLYEIAAGRSLTVTLAGEALIARASEFRPAELIPKSEVEFVWFNPDSNVDGQLIFTRDENGRVTHAIFQRDRLEVWRARKIK